MDLSTPTNPETEAPKADEREVETPEETLEAEAEADAPEGEEEAAPPEEEEELDIDGDNLKVKKSLAEKLKARMMMQADYTQKTQTLAEQRKALEAERQASEWEAQTRQELFKEEAALHNVRERLAKFQDVNWTALAQQNQQQAIAMQAEYTQLRDIEHRLSGHVEGRKADLAKAREQETAIQVQTAIEHLSKPDPSFGWDGRFDGDRYSKMTEFLVKKGADPEAVGKVVDPFSWKIINLAILGDKYLAEQRKAPQRPAAEPAAKVPAAKAQGYMRDPEKMSMAQYAAGRKAGRIK